jgi:hypothetical protein
MAVPRDTTPEARAIQMERLRNAGPEARLAMAAELSDAVRELALAAIRRQNPGFDEHQAREALAERLYGTLIPPRDASP